MKNRQQKVSILGLLTVTAFAVAMVAGCKPAESPIVGKWSDGKGKGDIEFKKDNTFTQTGAVVVVGKWTLTDKKVGITIDTIGGKSIDETLNALAAMNPKGPKPDIAKLKAQVGSISLTLSDDGKTLTVVPPAGAPSGSPAMTLTKQETK